MFIFMGVPGLAELLISVPQAARSVESLIGELKVLVHAESPSRDHLLLERCAGLISALGEVNLGISPQIEIDEGVPRILFDFGAHPQGRGVLILCHYDTVWEQGAWRQDLFSNDAGVIRGPGAFDMKAGILQGFRALRLLREAGQSLAGVRVLVTGDEEVGSGTSRGPIEALAKGMDAVLVLEASADGGTLKTARKGISIYRLEIQGLASHTGLDLDKGVNATVEAAHQVLAVSALADPVAGTSVTPTVLRSGTTTNTVPARALLDLDVRAWTVPELERVDAALRALLPNLPGIRLRLDGGINRPPLEPAASAGLYALSQEVAAGLAIDPPGSAAVGGASDGNFTAGIGVPTLDGLGAVGGGAHSTEEYMLVGAIAERTALLAGIVQRILQGDFER
ncbi:M20/M25/M40 family metallo-hydrolase [Arthrobacter russicus]|uniref:Glutamate carboxypeptidase n=1 Tax=Arthrobacter russicus TaxID=172040 RepID=A0ABU1J885_9MICC|nr:M20/M25/M40 family metallo-hydrolase [Arthrobacter russicus]MDR6268647.1 glutamate carboxypeptidase [Arthrobacter russicus]